MSTKTYSRDRAERALLEWIFGGSDDGLIFPPRDIRAGVGLAQRVATVTDACFAVTDHLILWHIARKARNNADAIRRAKDAVVKGRLHIDLPRLLRAAPWNPDQLIVAAERLVSIANS